MFGLRFALDSPESLHNFPSLCRVVHMELPVQCVHQLLFQTKRHALVIPFRNSQFHIRRKIRNVYIVQFCQPSAAVGAAGIQRRDDHTPDPLAHCVIPWVHHAADGVHDIILPVLIPQIQHLVTVEVQYCAEGKLIQD